MFVLGFGQEPHVAEVDSQEWGRLAVGDLGGPQDRAVATEHHGDLATCGGLVVDGDDLDLGTGSVEAQLLGLWGDQPDDDPVGGQRLGEGTCTLTGAFPAGVSEQQDSARIGPGSTLSPPTPRPAERPPPAVNPAPP